MMPRCASPPESAASPAVPPGASRPTWRSSAGRRSCRDGDRGGGALAGRHGSGLVGFYGPGNYGDELFLDVFRRYLGPVADVGVVFDSPSRPYFHRPVRDVVREHDAIVIGGGDLFVPWGLGDRYWLTDYLRRPVHVIGVGVPDLAARQGRRRRGAGRLPAPPERPLDHGARRGERGVDPRAPPAAGRGGVVGRPRVRAADARRRAPSRSADPRHRRPLARGRRRLRRGPGTGGARPRARVIDCARSCSRPARCGRATSARSMRSGSTTSSASPRTTWRC